MAHAHKAWAFLIGHLNMNTPKSDMQLLYESVRHTIACKHSVPKHLTEEELKLILNLLKPIKDRE